MLFFLMYWPTIYLSDAPQQNSVFHIPRLFCECPMVVWLPSPFCLPLGIPRPILSLSSGISRWLPNVSSSARLFAWANYHDGYRFTLSCYGSLDILAPSHRYLMTYNKLWRARHIGRPVSRGHFYQNINNAFWKMYRIEHDVTKCMIDKLDETCLP